MAQRVQVLLVDDLDGGEGAETVSFALDGHTYEIDLSEENARTLRSNLEKYIASARRLKGSRSSASVRSVPARTGRTAEIRQWALRNGYKISSRGRVQAEIVEAYEAALAS